MYLSMLNLKLSAPVFFYMTPAASRKNKEGEYIFDYSEDEIDEIFEDAGR